MTSVMPIDLFSLTLSQENRLHRLHGSAGLALSAAILWVMCLFESSGFLSFYCSNFFFLCNNPLCFFNNSGSFSQSEFDFWEGTELINSMLVWSCVHVVLIQRHGNLQSEIGQSRVTSPSRKDHRQDLSVRKVSTLVWLASSLPWTLPQTHNSSPCHHTWSHHSPGAL